MKQDIQSREDITALVEAFYSKLLNSLLLAHIFTDIANINLKDHLPIISDFWSFFLLNIEGQYSRNVMSPHLALAQKIRLRKEHFDEWLHLWEQSIDEMYIGEKAEEAKTRARNIALMIEYKIKAMESKTM